MSVDRTFPKTGKKPKAPPARIPRVGKKRAQDDAELAVSIPLLKERSRGRCEVNWSPLCTGVGTQAHHVQRRSQGGTNEPDNLLWSCFIDHARIHDQPEQARARGFLA